MKDTILRELHILIHERPIVFFVLMCAGSAYALLIGNLYSGHIVENIPLAVYDMDGSALSRELIRNTKDIDRCILVEVTGDEEEAMSLLADKTVAGVLVIPQGFSEKFLSRQPVELGFWQDGSNILQAGYALSDMQAMLGTYSATLRSQYAMANGTPELPIVPVQLDLRLLGNPTQSYGFFYLYGVMLTAVQIGIMLSFSLAIQGDSRNHYFAQHGIWYTLATKELFYVTLSTCSAIIGLTLLTGIFGMPYRGSILQALVLWASYIFAAANVAGLAAMYFRTELSLVQCLVFYALPAFLMSGYIWPEVGMTDTVRLLSYIHPMHYSLIDFRNLALLGSSPTWAAHVLTLLAMGTTGATIIGLWLHYREKTALSLKEAV